MQVTFSPTDHAVVMTRKNEWPQSVRMGCDTGQNELARAGLCKGRLANKMAKQQAYKKNHYGFLAWEQIISRKRNCN